MYRVVIIFIVLLWSFNSVSSELETMNRVLFDKKILMQDGINLSANIWLPTESSKKYTAVLHITPYSSPSTHLWASKFTGKGYAYIGVDLRGRGNSEGIFTPLEEKKSDGHDIIEWIIQQPWSNKKVVMRGASYTGMMQWKVMGSHPNLLAAIPTSSVYPGEDFPKVNGIFKTYMARWLSLVNGRTPNNKLFADSSFWSSIDKKIYNENLSFSSLIDISPINTSTIKKWLLHPDEDSYWKSINPAPEDYSGIDIPVLTITGYFDSDQKGSLRYYNEHMKHASKKGRDNHYLVIGPWDHTGTSKPTSETQGLTFAKNAKIDMFQLQVDWFDWVTNGGEKPSFLKERVAYYVMGQNEWEYTSTLEKMSSDTMNLYLSSPQGNADDMFHSGFLGLDRIVDSTPDVDSYIYDPLRNIDLEYPSKTYPYTGKYSQRDGFIENTLIYHSAPLTEAVTVSGQIKFHASISMNVKDTDFKTQVFVVMPDGMTIDLGKDKLRARYRKSRSEPSLVEPGKIEKYVFSTYDITSRKLPKGSRIRLILSALDDYSYDKNYNSGKSVSNEDASSAVTATVKLHLGGGKSYLELPLKD